DLAAAGIGADCLDGIEGEIRTEQVPRREGQPGNSDNHYAGEQRAVGPYAPQEDVGRIDSDEPVTAPDAQEGTLLPQALRELGEQPIHPTGRAEDPRAPLTRRAMAGHKIDALVTAQAPQGKKALPAEGAQQWAAQNPAVGQPDMAHGRRQAQLLGQGPHQRGNRPPFDIEQGPHQDTGPLRDSPLTVRIEVGSEDVTVALKVLCAPGDVLE